MTLVLENAIRAFDCEAASLFEPSDAELQQNGAVEFSLETVYRFAEHYESLTPSDHPEWTCLPLHEPDSAALTDSYLAYTDHSIRGEIIIHAEGDGHTFIPVDEFVKTPLARRLRYWHPDYLPATDPAYYEAPFDDREPPVRSVAPEKFFDGVESYLAQERAATIESSREEYDGADPIELYEGDEDALPALRSRGLSGGTEPILTLGIDFDRLKMSERVAKKRPHFVSNTFGIYEDDPVLLVPPNREASPESLPMVATVEETSSTRVTVRVDLEGVDSVGATRRYLKKDRVGYGLIKLFNPLPHQRREEAIQRVRNDPDFRGVLTGQRALTFTQPRVADSEHKDPELNQEQQAAVRYALLADDLFCIHGPPGTGKTRTLVEIVRRAVDAGESVLVCADSNQAVDNILVGDSTADEPDPASLHAHGQHGSGEFTLDRRNVRQSDAARVQEWYRSQPGDEPEVVAATNGSSARIKRQFDMVVIDEATQAAMPASMVALANADTAILAGDHRQLPPFSQTEDPPDSAFGLSLFEHIYGDEGVFEDVGLQLRTQYRMHRDIAHFPNREFYNDSLQTGIDVEPLPDEEPIQAWNIGGGETVVGTSYANPSEATMIERLVGRLRDDGVEPEEIGIISPYAGQVERIRERLETDAVTVNTIDSFQGSEREVILISLVRSNSDGEIGFLGRPEDGPRRLNVAMTRAKQLCVVVGDWSTLQQAPADRDDASPLYQSLAKYLRDTGRMHSFDPVLLG